MNMTGGAARLVDLAATNGDGVTMTDVHAEDATILGPGVLYAVEEVTIEGCQWDTGGGGFEALVWDVDPAVRPVVVGAIAARACSFIRCRFVGVGVAGAPDFVRGFAEGMMPG